MSPDDDTDLTVFSRALWIGSAGDLKVTMVNGQTVTFVGCPAGDWMPLRVSRVHNTDTTADDIVAVW